jgi:hypothetical protein
MKTPDNWEDPTPVPIVTSCKQAARLVSVSFERRLTLRELFSMRLHLMMCKTCTFYRRQIKALRAIFIRHEEVLSNTPAVNDENLSDQAKDRIKKTINENS